MANDVPELGALDLARAYRSGALSPVEVVEAALARIAQLDPDLAAFCHLDPQGALTEARASEARWRRGEAASALDGVPICFKDNIAVARAPSLWGAAGVPPTPATFDSCAVSRVREAGMPILGKTAMAEMGFYASGANSRYPPPRNPHDRARTAGGSSGGAAAAVAGGLAPLAVGSDGAGSVRMPASFCGIVGFKPSGGRVPTLPAMGQNPVLGPMARCVEDAAALLQVIAQPDHRDHHALPLPPPAYASVLDLGVAGLRIGYLPEIGFGDAVAPDVANRVRAAARALESQGAEIVELPPVFSDDLFDGGADAGMPPLAQLIMALTGGRVEGLLPPTRQALDYARTVDLDRYLRASQFVAAAVRDFAAAARPYAVLLTPTLTRTAFGAEEIFPPDAPTNRFGYAFGFASFVQIANLAGVPACSVPCGRDADGLPIGVQIIGKKCDEATVLRVAMACERACGLLMPTTLRVP